MTDRPQPAPYVPEPDTVYGEDLPYLDHVTSSTRTNGWCGARQRRFLEGIADGLTVRDACKLVGLSPASAYAFRRGAKGRGFDLGWKAADLLARERVAADLMERATDGQEVQVTRADGTVFTRHSYDNRLAVTMLNRLDRYADASENTAPGRAARLVAGDFDAYLQLIGDEGGPARAGLYMLARAEGEGASPDLEPVLALARADRLIRSGALGAGAADLDPARRADWTAEQWARAEAAGLFVLAPSVVPGPSAPEPDFTRQPCSTCCAGAAPDDDDERNAPVWWYDDEDMWRTSFPPRAGFRGSEYGVPGAEGYERELDADELAIMEAPYEAERAERLALGAERRDAFFAAHARANEASAPGDAPAGPAAEIIPPAPCIPGDSRALADGPQLPTTIRSDHMADTSKDVTVLNSLVKTLNDSIKGYQESAKDIGNQRFQSMFQDRAMERQSVVTKLQAEVGRLGGDPSDGGSLLGSAHQIFLDMKSAVTGKDDQAILAEVQRGEEYLREKFDTALADGDLSPSVRSVVEQAAQSVRQGADAIRQHNGAM